VSGCAKVIVVVVVAAAKPEGWVRGCCRKMVRDSRARAAATLRWWLQVASGASMVVFRQ